MTAIDAVERLWQSPNLHICISIASVAAIDVMHHPEIAPPVKPPEPFLPAASALCRSHLPAP